MNKTLRISIPFIVTCLMVGILVWLLGTTNRASAANPQTASLGEIKQGDLVVTTLQDVLYTDGHCSLREAIQTANTNTTVDACGSGSVMTDGVKS